MKLEKINEVIKASPAIQIQGQNFAITASGLECVARQCLQ